MFSRSASKISASRDVFFASVAYVGKLQEEKGDVD